MAMHEIDPDGADRKVCRNYVNNLWGQGKSETLKKLGYRTVYRPDES